MKAVIGDQLHVHGKTVGSSDTFGEIVDVKGADGEPPYLVRFGDGHLGIVFPGPDAVIEHGAPRDTSHAGNHPQTNG